MQLADAVIHEIADEQVAVAIAKNAVRLAELGFVARASVAGETRDAGAGSGGDDAGLHVDFADDVVVALGEVEVAFEVEDQLMGRAE